MPEGLLHLAEAPVRQMQKLETACETLGQPLLDEQGSRAQEDHFERALGARILVPQPLDGLRPMGHLLHFIHNQQSPRAITLASQQARRLPLLTDPFRPAQGRLICAGETTRQLRTLHHLRHQSGLAHLPGPRDHLEEAPGLLEAAGELRGQGSSVLRFTHGIE